MALRRKTRRTTQKDSDGPGYYGQFGFPRTRTGKLRKRGEPDLVKVTVFEKGVDPAVPGEVGRVLAQFMLDAQLQPASSPKQRAEYFEQSVKHFQQALESASEGVVRAILEESPVPTARVTVSDEPSPAELIALREAFELAPPQFAVLLGYKERTLADWERGAKHPGTDTVRRYQELARLFGELGGVMKPDFVPRWLQQANPSFGGESPLQLIQDRRAEEIWRMIFELRYAPLA